MKSRCRCDSGSLSKCLRGARNRSSRRQATRRLGMLARRSAILSATCAAVGIVQHVRGDVFDGTTNVVGSTLSSPSTSLGISEIGVNTAGTVNVGAAGTWNNSYNIGVGWNTSGTLLIQNGGQVFSGPPAPSGPQSFVSDSSIGGGYDSNGGMYLGTGTVIVTGVGSAWTANSEIIVGRLNEGIMQILAGGHVSSLTGAISDGTDLNTGQPNTGGFGSLLIDGTSSQWSVGNGFQIGVNGTAIATVQNGGLLNINATDGENAELSIGLETSVDGGGFNGPTYNGAGTLNISGGTVNFNQAGASIGPGGQGALLISHGGEALNMSDLDIGGGLNSSSKGSVNITDANSLLDASFINVGGFGAGTLSVQSGATVNVGGNLSIGPIAAQAGSGTTLIEAPGTLNLTGGQINIGGQFLTDSGTFSHISISGGTLIAASTVNIGTIGQSGGFTSLGIVQGGGGSGGTLTVGTGTMTVSDAGDQVVQVNSAGTFIVASSHGEGSLTSLTVNSGGNVLVQLGGELEIVGATTTNNGAITIGAAASASPDQLVFTGTGSNLLTGAGAVVLNNSPSLAQFEAIEGASLTLDTQQSISGRGEINATLINNGTINANVNGGSLLIANQTVTNNGVVKASNGGILEIGSSGLLALSATGQTTTDATSTIIVDSDGTIDGRGTIAGTVANNGTISADVSAATLTLSSNNITNNGLLQATNSATMYLAGLTLNQGTLGTIAANGGSVNLTNATVIGGSIAGSGSLNASSVTLNGVTLASGTLPVADATTTTIKGTFTNNGTVTINPTKGGHATSLLFGAGATSLLGTGQVILNQNGADSQIVTASGGTLTIGSQQTVAGTGQINAAFTNNGTIDANINTSALAILANSITNNGTFEATSGGILNIAGLTLTQGADGNIVANGGSVNLTGANITGGAIGETGGGSLQLAGATLSFVGVTPGTTLPIFSGQTLNLSGAISNGGTILVNADQLSPPAILNASSATFSGGGQIILNFPGSSAQLNGSFTQASGNTIAGQGQINAAMTNAGIVNANVSGATLTLQTNPMSNTGTLEATGGGILDIDGITVTQGSGGRLLGDGTSMIIIGSGGTFAGQGAIDGKLTNNGTILANVSGASLSLASSNITNNGIAEATGGGTLSLAGITFNQTSAGQLIADTASTVDMTHATIVGGTIGGPGTIIAPNVSLNGVTLAAGATLNVPDNTTTTVSGNSINNGTISVNSNHGSDATILDFTGASPVLNGSGTILLNQPGGASQLNTGTGALLTVGSLLTVAGQGQINAAFVNNGTVTANINGGILTPTNGNITNNGSFLARNGGELNLAGRTIHQGSAGEISSGALSDIELGGGTISGGLLDNSSGGNLAANNITLQNVTLTTGSNINVPGGTADTVIGTFTNNGSVVLNNNHGGGGGQLFFTGGADTLNGTGSIILADISQYSQIEATAGTTVTVGSFETIAGQGYISAPLINNGTIDGDDVSNYGQHSAITLYNSNMTNNGVMQGSNGGSILIDGITITQGANGVIQGNGGNAFLENNAKIVGGHIASNNGVVGAISAGTAVDSIQNVTVDSGTFNIDGGVTLNASGTITNNGTFFINDNHASGNGVLNFVGGAGTINGSGAIVLADLDHYSELNTSNNSTITIGSQQTVVGQGQINAALVNNGTIDAFDFTNYGEHGPLFLESNSMTNNNVMEATGGGSLLINGIAVTQSGAGQMVANGGEVAMENGAMVIGGTLSSIGSNSLIAAVTGNTQSTLSNVTITSGSTFGIDGAVTLNATGTLTNNGTIQINDNHGNGSTFLNFNGVGNNTLDGSGAVILWDYDHFSQVSTAPGSTLTIGAQQTIEGQGFITATLTNNGTINGSDVSAYGDHGPLYLLGQGMTNNGTMQASAGGQLAIDGVGITQSAGGLIRSIGSSDVLLENGASIVGGTIASDATSDILANAGGSSISNLTVAPGSTVNVNGGITLNASGIIINNGNFFLNNNHGSGNGILNFTAGANTLNGSGSIILADYDHFSELNTAPGGTLMIGATQTVIGQGQINAALINNGTVTANDFTSYGDHGPLYLQSDDETNNGTMSATGGGTLVVNGIAVNQSAAGQMLATNGGAVELENGALIVGGKMSSDATSFLAAVGNTQSTLSNVTVTTGSTFDIDGGVTLNVNGTLTNNGTFLINDNHGSGNAYLNFNGTGNNTLSGSGIIVLNDLDHFSQISAGPASTLTVGSAQTIIGQGYITANLTNNGTIAANDFSNYGEHGPLFLLGNTLTNNGTLSAFGGGTLQSGQDIINNGSIVASNSGNVILNAVLTNNPGSSVSVDATSSIVFNGNVSGVSVISGAGAKYFASTASGGGLSATGTTIVQSGAALNIDFLRESNVSIAGTVAITPGGGAAHVSRVNTLAITGQLDLANDALIVDYTGASPLSTIRGYIASGFAGGNWNGVGIASSSAESVAADSTNPHKTGLGYGEASTLGITSLDGQTFDNTAVVVRYALYGDANLDGTVNALDFNALATNYGQNASSNVWTQGDFNYDGAVNSSDFALLAANYNSVLPASAALPDAVTSNVVTPNAATPLGAVVPEPGMICMLLLAPLLTPRRRKNR